MATVKVKLNGEAVAAFLRGDEGRLPADLLRRARNVAGAAGPGHQVSGRRGKHRFRASVAGLPNEQRGVLLSALDAGRAQ